MTRRPIMAKDRSTRSRDGYRGYVWCTNPAGTRYRKYVKGKTYEATHQGVA